MKLKHLVSLLQQVDPFEKPKILLEQYPTSAELAGEMLFAIANQDRTIQDHIVMDLGVGTGMLSIGAMAYQPSLLVGVDIDADALDQCDQNIRDLLVDADDDEDQQPLPNYQLILADIRDEHVLHRWAGVVDTVLMNPPFGTKKNSGLDMVFLERAVQLAKKYVYSLHKSSTRSYVLKKIKDWGHSGEVMAQLRFDIPAMYRFHKEASKDIQVDLIKIRIRS